MVAYRGVKVGARQCSASSYASTANPSSPTCRRTAFTVTAAPAWRLCERLQGRLNLDALVVPDPTLWRRDFLLPRDERSCDRFRKCKSRTRLAMDSEHQPICHSTPDQTVALVFDGRVALP
jgi:hypothetical protein